MNSQIIQAKLNAVKEALKYIKDGMILGLGSGSTVELLIENLDKKIKQEKLEIHLIPASSQTYFSLVNRGIKPESLDLYDEVDLTIDGADEVDERKYALKGRGGALLREKILSSYSKTYIIIVDYTKYSKIIGEKASVCIEVIPFAATPVLKRIKKMCEKAHIRYGERLKDGPIVTDNHNYIIDAYFGKIENPENLSNEINKISGVVENGIFLENISKIIVGYEKDVKII
jgi:ribose 5-phosphate isomerase